MASFIIEAYFLNYLSIVTTSQARLIDLFTAGTTTTSTWKDFHSSIDGEATVTVVFATIVLESYILNYASRRLGGEFAEKKMDRLSLVRKWIEVPRRVNGVGIPEDCEAVKLLGQLVRARHSIVHLKSPNTSFTEIQSGKPKRSCRRRENLQAALDAVNCIAALGDHLAKIDSNEGFAKLFAKLKELPRYRLNEVTHEYRCSDGLTTRSSRWAG